MTKPRKQLLGITAVAAMLKRLQDILVAQVKERQRWRRAWGLPQLLARSKQVVCAITFIAATSAGTNGGTTLTIDKPLGTVNGHLMAACVCVTGGTGATITAPSNWTLKSSANSTTAIKFQTFWKIAANEGASFDWTLDTSRPCAGGIASYAGVDQTTPTQTPAVQQSNASSANCEAPTITPAQTPTLLVYFGGGNGAFTWTPPTEHGGMSERVDKRADDVTAPCATLADCALVGLTASGVSTGVMNSAAVNIGVHWILNTSATGTGGDDYHHYWRLRRRDPSPRGA